MEAATGPGARLSGSGGLCYVHRTREIVAGGPDLVRARSEAEAANARAAEETAKRKQLEAELARLRR